MWSNFHTHSRYCDGKSELTEYAWQASASGMVSLGFSSHAPLPFDCAWCMKAERLPDYLDEINTLQVLYPSLEFYKGLEVDFIPGKISPGTFGSQLDYTIGSVHFVDAFADGRHWEIDGPFASFREGLQSIFSGDIRAAVSRYFELTREMLKISPPTILGHLDKIKIQNVRGHFYEESDSWYRRELEKTIDTIASSCCIVEVNTRGLYQKKSPTPYPSPWILKALQKREVPVTLSSDAHHPDDLFNAFASSATLLNEIGFTKLTILRHGRWRPYDYNEYGIIVRD
jgi:histidinol-phosphatase (PHP family)